MWVLMKANPINKKRASFCAMSKSQMNIRNDLAYLMTQSVKEKRKKLNIA